MSKDEVSVIRAQMNKIEDKIDAGMSRIEDKFDNLPKTFVTRREYDAEKSAKASSNRSLIAVLSIVVPIITTAMVLLISNITGA